MTVEFADKPKRGRPRSSTSASVAQPVQALDRGLTILAALAKHRSAALSALARQVEMPPSTVHRFLATLQTHGFADFDGQTQEWSVGIGAFRVGNTYLRRSNLVEAAQAPMRSLMEQTGETANLGIADQGFIVFISQIETQNPIRAMFQAGARSPMHASGIGKAMLAYLSAANVEQALRANGQPSFTPQTLTTPESLHQDLVRSQARGWSFDNEERHTGMCCIAAPIFDREGQPVAGVSVSGPAARFTREMIASTGPLVQQTAAEITAITGA